MPWSPASTPATFSPKRKVTDRSRRWNFSASTISASQNSSIRSRCSTTVTLLPSAANIEAYSMPITPAPTTTRDRGIVRRVRIPSESRIRSPSNSTVGGRAGRVPVAMIDVLGPHLPRSGLAVHRDRVRVEEPRRAVQQRHPVAGQLAADHLDLAADHVLGAREQVLHGDVVLDPVVLPVQLAHVQPGEVEHRLAQRLRRDGAGVDAHPADHVAALHHGGPAAELRRRDGRLLPSRPRAEHEHVVVVVAHHRLRDRAGCARGRGASVVR